MSDEAPTPTSLPSYDELFAFIQQNPDKSTIDRLVRVFHIEKESRASFRKMVKGIRARLGIGVPPPKKSSRNKLLDVDEVAVVVTGSNNRGELFGRPLQWQGTKEVPKLRLYAPRKDLLAFGVGDNVSCKIRTRSDHKGTLEGHIIRKMSEEATRVLGVVIKVRQGLALKSADRRDRQFYSITEIGPDDVTEGDFVVAEIIPGRLRDRRRTRVVERIGSMKEANTIDQVAIRAHALPTKFSSEAIQQATSTQPVVLGMRTDLRHIPLVTIDGANAKDFDDAVWAENTNDGGWHVIVAIADVAHYVRPATFLDQVARERGNSAYFPNMVVPMLPRELSNDLCSLRPNTDRPCLAVHIWLDKSGRKIRHNFVRGLMHSAARLTYQRVQTTLNGQPSDVPDEIYETVLKPLHRCCRALRRQRKKRGALEITTLDRDITVDENGRVLNIQPCEQTESNQIVEEMMIAANVCAAETLESLKQPCMYRVHDEPAEDRVDEVRSFLQVIGLNVDEKSNLKSYDLNMILGRVKGTRYEHIVNTVVLRSQSQAIYTPSNRGHFGLSLSKYAHFTSPIRRYADLLVHRSLIKALDLYEDIDEKKQYQDQPPFEDIAAHLSRTERRAAQAERDAVERYTARFLEKSIGTQFHGRITGVRQVGLFVELTEIGATGLVPVSTLGNDFYVHDEATHRLFGRSGKTVYALGDPVTVILRQADAVTGGILFEVVPEYKKKRGKKKEGKSPSPRK